MSDSELNLLLLGGVHIKDSSARFELTKQTFDHVDTVFIESVTKNESSVTKLISGLRAPLIVPICLFALKAMNYYTKLTGKGDGELRRDIVDEFDADVIEIDHSFFPIINESPWFWPLSNYVALLSSMLSYIWIGSMSVSLLTPVSLLLLYLASTLYGRDAKMALDIEQYAQAKSGNAVAIIGSHHQTGVVSKLANSSIVRIVSKNN
ncbi:hypothetical protein [Halorubrum vacuolatum]|uniref:Uncharacterized protein n=1 Tax=Halorubrum vacuolatum TaxID=63740 RepID=A0A238W989_HALVU|nr:hypothetical protein [Halorubrum vacuolatum]SNR43155.1 hypothetical protein SAMN06264855_10668 [Halorubrum vacuolatum]